MEFLIIIIVVFIVYTALAFKRPGIAIATSPIASIGCASIVFAGLIPTDETQIVGIILAGLIVPAVLAVIRLVSPAADGINCWSGVISVWFFSILAYLALLSIMAATFNFFGIGMLFLFVVFVCRYYITHCRAIEMDIISTIGACMRQNLPLPTALDTAAMSYPNKHARIFRNISKWLTQGYSLSESLKNGYPQCPAYITSSVTAGESFGQLPETLRSIEAEIAEKSDETKKIPSVNWVYVILELTVVTLVGLGIMIFIIPTFAVVLDDMGDGASLPYLTQVMLNISNWLVGRCGLNALLAVVLPLLLLNSVKPVMLLLGRIERNRDGKQSLFLVVADFIKWHTPFWHWFENNYSLMRVAAILRVGIVSGCPVDVAIKQTCQLNINFCFQRCLQRWLICVERGDNISSSAIKCGIGHSIAWAFDDEVNAGNTPELLHMLEKCYRENLSYKLNVARAASGPFVILLLGAFVGLVAFSMFLPIVKIITVLTESVVP